MELKNYIENAEKKAGSQKKLADILGISAGYIRMAKGEKRGFPEAICIKLADYLNEDRLSVIAASGLVTEKDQERRKILESCFSASRAASFTATALFLSVILIMTPSSAHASWATVSGDSIIEYFVLCKIHYTLLKAWQKIGKSLSSLNFIFQPLLHHSHFAEYPYIR